MRDEIALETLADEGVEHNEEDVEGDNEEKIPEYLFKLFIADRGNSRVVVWNELPVFAEEEDEDEEDDGIEVEDPNLLIGEDEDDDYSVDEEDISPEELPSV